MKRLRAPLLCAIVALAAVPTLVGRGAAHAATAGAASGARGSVPAPPGVSLVTQSPWVALHSSFAFVLHVDDRALAARPGAALAVRVHSSVTTRTSFDAAVQDGRLGGTLYQPNTISLASIPRDAHGNLVVVFGLARSGVTPAIGIARAGVYPVEIGLTNTGEPTGAFVTWLVVVDTSAAHGGLSAPLGVAMIWQLVARPIAQPAGSDDRTVVRALAPGGRIDRIASLLASTAGAPVSLVVSPETVESWARLAVRDRALLPSLARVRAAVNRPTSDLLAAPYVPIDATALEGAGLGDQLPDEFVRGSSTLQDVLGTTPLEHTPTMFLDPADDAAVDRLRAMLVERIAVRDGSLAAVTHQFSPAQPFTLATDGGTLEAVSTAPYLERLLGGTAPAAVRVERVVAALAEVAYETPGITRGVLIAPSAEWDPDVAAMSALVRDLRDFPLVQPMTLDELFATVPAEQQHGAGVERHLQARTPPPLPVSASEYEAAAAQLAELRDVVGADDPSVRAAEQALAVALSNAITSDEAHAELGKVDAAVHAYTSGITTTSKRITLTSRHAKVPLSFENTKKPSRPVQVRIRLESQKLSFPNGADQVVTLPPGNTTVVFEVEARTSGTFPMTITITSADGNIEFGPPVRVTVRSAVFSGIGLALTIAALVFLAGWWGNHFRRTRRERRAAAMATT